MHLCAAKCCDDRQSSIDTVQGCVERCSGSVTKAQRFVHTEVEEFQGRLQRCVMVSAQCLSNQIKHIYSKHEFHPAMQRRRESADAGIAQ